MLLAVVLACHLVPLSADSQQVGSTATSSQHSSTPVSFIYLLTVTLEFSSRQGVYRENDRAKFLDPQDTRLQVHGFPRLRFVVHD